MLMLCEECSSLLSKQNHTLGLMHQNMHIIYSELNESVLLLDIVFLIPLILNGSLISVAVYNFFH